MNTKITILVVLVFLAIIIMLQNTQDAVFQVLFWSIFVPRILLIFIVLLLGFGIGYVAATTKARKSSGSE
jgi:uncharacterized integral membrane protein